MERNVTRTETLRRVPLKPVSELTLEDLGGHHPDTVCVVRYGAIGDMIMMSSILPELKKKYKRVCVNTTPKGFQVVRNDPNIDEFLMQESKQIPVFELDSYWVFG